MLDDHRYRDAACGIAGRMANARSVHRRAEIIDVLIASNGGSS